LISPIIDQPELRLLVRVDIQMVDPARIEGRTPPDQAPDFVVLAEQQFRQIRAILTRNSGDQRLLRHDILRREYRKPWVYPA
jgi:hypothetical protein